MPSYRICGLTVASDIALPELAGEAVAAEVLASELAAPDMEFRIGPVAALAAPTHTIRGYQLDGERALHWTVPGMGRMLASGGTRLVLEPEPGVSEVAIRSNMIGTIQAALWYQRGHIVLHGSAVRRGDAAIVIGGATGAGKSALTALLAERGMPLLADDLCVLSAGEAPVALLPGYAALRLWDAVADMLEGATKVAGAHASGGKSVVHFAGQAAALPGPIAISDLVILEPRRETFAIRRGSEFELLQRWAQLVHLAQAAQAMGRMPQIVRQFHALIAGGTRVWLASLPEGMPQSRAVVSELLEVIDARA